MIYLNFKKLLIIISISILSLFVGFILNEDLSTGGARLDFFDTFEAVIKYANLEFDFNTLHTRHFPLHYLILSLPQMFFENIQLTRLFYLIFAMLVPIFLFFNLNLLYPHSKINNLFLSFSILFLPYFRVSIIWANAHLTAVLFLLVSNFFFLKYKKNNSKLDIFYNLLFLSLATYSIQSYAVFFIYYLYFYFINLKKFEFFNILIICFIFSLPGFYLVFITPLGAKLDFSSNLAYTLLTNSSIIFFFLIFFILNKKSSVYFKEQLSFLNYKEFILILILYISLVLTFQTPLTPVGGGFFYKISFFLFGNEYLFFFIGYLALNFIYILFKVDKNLFFIIFLTNLTSIAYYTSQRYFEPLLIVVILSFSHNLLTKNLLLKTVNLVIFYIITLVYLLLAFINNSYKFSVNLPIN